MTPRSTAWGVARRSGLLALSRWAYGPRLRILCYHGIEDDPDPCLNYDGLQVSPQSLHDQLELIARSYTPVHVAEMVRAVAEGRPLAEDAVAVTFDDGYKDNIDMAVPLLRRYGVPATFYVATGFVDGTFVPWWQRFRAAVRSCRAASLDIDGRVWDTSTTSAKQHLLREVEGTLKRLSDDERTRVIRGVEERGGGPSWAGPSAAISWDELRSLVRSGFHVAAHTVNHVSLPDTEPARAEEEIEHSVLRVRSETKADCTTFAYPYGGATSAAVDVLRRLGVKGAVTAEAGASRYGEDPFLLRRWTVMRMHGRDSFEAMISGATEYARAVLGRA